MAIGGKATALTQPEIIGVQVTTSLYNNAIPLLIGKRRAAGRVIWYGDFGPSSGSSKKQKSSKKGGPKDYQANLDLLISFGPIWNIQSTWSNSSIVGYGSGLSSYSQAGHQDFTITGADSFSDTVSNQPSGYNLDFIAAISFIPDTPLSTTINDYGDPLGSRTITESLTEQWLYNTYFNAGVPETYAWRPGSWEFGQPYCNNASCSFPVGADHGGASFACTFPANVTGTIRVYWGATKSGHDTPLSYIKYEFEAKLGSGNEYSSTPSQQIQYPELSGVGGVQIDLGASGAAPQLDIEAQGLYSLTNSGQVNPADFILDLILSGNIFFNKHDGEWTPLCFSHGLNFGGDPTRTNFQSFDPGYPGTQVWPPTVSFPWVLPGVTSGSSYTSGSLFQILRDPPTFDQGLFDYSTSGPYAANSIVRGSDDNYYRALTYGSSDPVGSGSPPSGSPLWVQFDGNFSDGLTDIRNYCAANGIYVSALLNSQRDCSEILTELCEISNSVAIWNGQALDFYPLSEVSCVGGGYVYTPRTASGPLASFDYRHFVCGDGEAPVIVKQTGMQSVANILDVNYTEAGFDSNGACGYQAYQSSSVRICDAEHCQLYGPMNGSPRSYDDYICDATTATKVGWPIIKRQRFADPYLVEFKLPSSIASLLDPMDLITCADPTLFGGKLPSGSVTTGPGAQDVRIQELTEAADGEWTLSCERFMYGMSAPSAPTVATPTPNPPPSQAAGAGSVNTPYFFEPTQALAQALGMSAANSLCIAVSGSADNYGGCQVFVSTDGGASYPTYLGSIVGNPDVGVTYNSDYPSHANPDGSNTLYADLTESKGELESFTSAQQSQLVSIALIDGGGSGSAGGYTTTIPYEIVAYEAATLVSADKYSCSPTILRGQLGSVPADHPIGKVFVDLSTTASLFKTTVPSGNILGNTLYFKFATFNKYGTAVQDLSDCTPYAFAVTGQTNPGGSTGGGSYQISPNPCLYQGKSGGWSGVDGGSGSWTNPNDIYFPPITVNYATGPVTYSANDSGTTAFTGSGQTVFVCIYDPSHAGGTPTVDIQSTNVNATSPGYVFLGQITSASAPVAPGGTGGSSGSGGPQDIGGSDYLITVDGAAIA